MKRKRFYLYKTKCKRCGKEIFTGNKSLFGLDALKEQLGKICQNCITPKEKRLLESARPRVVN